MNDLFSHLSPAVAIAAAALDADPTPVVIDLQGYTSALFAISVGPGGITFTGTNKVEFKLSHGDASDALVAVADADVQLVSGSVGAGGIVKSLVAAHAAADVTKVGYIGGKRYVSLVPDFSGTHAAATPMSATCIRGGALREPV